MPATDAFEPHVEGGDHVNLGRSRPACPLVDVRQPEDDEADDVRPDRLRPEEGKPIEDDLVEQEVEERRAVDRVGRESVPVLEDVRDAFAQRERMIAVAEEDPERRHEEDGRKGERGRGDEGDLLERVGRDRGDDVEEIEQAAERVAGDQRLTWQRRMPRAELTRRPSARTC
jgi:hypothetical protein